jgi:predicted Kef-type K+ transport protein
VILVVTLAGGMVATLVRLPPLAGFLAAGFALNAMEVPHYSAIDTLAGLGVTLLLFGIGLKLDLRTLIRREVWLTATAHLVVTTALAAAFLGCLALLGVVLVSGQGWRTLVLIGFALSFSSTVFVVKVLEERNSAQALYGRTVIGILIIQDLAAVAFLTAVNGTPPSPWALLLVLVFPGAWLLRKVLGSLGHGEMQILFGIVVALVPGYALFDAVGIKGDVGALVMGMLLASHSRAGELGKNLFALKELLLVGFFVSIGFTGLPSADGLIVAGLLLLLVPLKAIGFVLFSWRHGLRHRTSVLTGLSLANYSEFGLIVIAAGVSADLVDEDWLVVLAAGVAASFVLSAAINRRADDLVAVAHRILPQQDPGRVHLEDRPIDVGHAHAVVLGMGRVGRAAYEQLSSVYGLQVVGIDSLGTQVDRLRDEGLDVVEGDATDPDFWTRLTRTGDVDIAVLAMPFHGANRAAMRRLKASEFGGTVAVVAQYDDEIDQALEYGADTVFQLYDGAGVTLADRAAKSAGINRPGD